MKYFQLKTVKLEDPAEARVVLAFFLLLALSWSLLGNFRPFLFEIRVRMVLNEFLLWFHPEQVVLGPPNWSFDP